MELHKFVEEINQTIKDAEALEMANPSEK